MFPCPRLRHFGCAIVSCPLLVLAILCLGGLSMRVEARSRMVEGFVAEAPLGFPAEVTHVMRFDPGGRIRVALVDPAFRLQSRPMERIRLLGVLASDRTVNDVPLLRVEQVIPSIWAQPDGGVAGAAAEWKGFGSSHFANIIEPPIPDAPFQPSIAPLDSDGDGVPDTLDAFPNDPSETLDTDGDTIGNNADPDDDNDEMPDLFELANGLDPLVDDADGDLDKDGMSNRDEFLAGTKVGDASSLLKVERVEVNWPVGVRVTWQSVRGRSYRVMVSGRPDGRYIQLGEDILAGQSLTALDIAISRREAASFYKIELVSP